MVSFIPQIKSRQRIHSNECYSLKINEQVAFLKGIKSVDYHPFPYLFKRINTHAKSDPNDYSLDGYLVLQIMDLFTTIEANYICHHRLDYALINKPWNLSGLIKQRFLFLLMHNVMEVRVPLRAALTLQ